MKTATQRAKDCGPFRSRGGLPACRFLTGMLIVPSFFNLLNLHNFRRAKVKFSNEDPMRIFFKGFYNYFSKFLHVRNQEIKLNMPKNYGINIFDYEGPSSLTHTL